MERANSKSYEKALEKKAASFKSLANSQLNDIVQTVNKRKNKSTKSGDNEVRIARFISVP